MKWQEKFYRKEAVDFKVGDDVKVSVKVKEGDKERIQIYEGVVISRRGSGLNETFKVRKISAGVGVERTFLLHSPAVAHVKTQRKGNVRRSKLFYLRDKVGKDSRVKEEMIMSAIPAAAEGEAPKETAEAAPTTQAK